MNKQQPEPNTNHYSTNINNYMLHTQLKIQSNFLLQSFEECVKNFKTADLTESENKCIKKKLINKFNSIDLFQ